MFGTTAQFFLEFPSVNQILSVTSLRIAKAGVEVRPHTNFHAETSPGRIKHRRVIDEEKLILSDSIRIPSTDNTSHIIR